MGSAQINNCTARSPMPADRDQMGQVWYHHDHKEVDGQAPESQQRLYSCLNCKTLFWVTRGEPRKVNPCFLREAQAKLKSMRARGWNPDA